ncbi:hypothetical protein [Methanobacterium sp.]|uniref:hypothetical protein n=1 Tax=Methanobacterium sp. TaxID=2164 RepID=UPI003C77E0FE
MGTENETYQVKIEESFLEIIKDFKGSYSGIFIKGVTDPEVIKEGNLEKIGTSLTRISEFLDNRLQDLEFDASEEKVNEINSRLKTAVKVINEMGKEIESLENQEPRDYHWYVVGALAVILIGLFDYIEIYMEHHP